MANEVLAVATWSQVYGRLKTLKGDSNSNSDRRIEKGRGSRKKSLITSIRSRGRMVKANMTRNTCKKK